MKIEQAALLQRLNDFELDVPGASFPFSKKLAAENHWPLAYTKRVIEEYKRFTFLAVASGHPVSPSEAVDQAWHMHLIYSQNYWKVFCPEILQTPLHHNPTQGGPAEKDKFADWYRRTLDSYREFFGSEPPADIWPSPEDRLNAPPESVRIDKATHWVIRKPNFAVSSRLGAVAIVSLAMLGCSSAVAAANPFDWVGPTFLRFYVFLFTVTLLTSIELRRFLRLPSDRGTLQPPNLDGYEMAYLNRGRWLAVDVAIASLVRQSAFSVVPGRRQFVQTQTNPVYGSDFEHFVHSKAVGPGGIKLVDIRNSCAPRVEPIGDHLKELGLLVDDDQSKKAVGIPLAVASLAPLVGLIKVFVGMSRDKPVGTLVLLCFISVFISVVIHSRKPFRSRYGDKVLKELRGRYTYMKSLGHHQVAVTPEELRIAVGLFGATALIGSDLDPVARALHTPFASESNSACSSGCGSGCGGGGCGGGGGGCGGCGGG